MGKGFVDREPGGIVAVARGDGSECAELAESEDAGLDGAGALEPSMVFGDGLGEIEFERAYWCEGIADASAVLVEGFVLIGSE